MSQEYDTDDVVRVLEGQRKDNRAAYHHLWWTLILCFLFTCASMPSKADAVDTGAYTCAHLKIAMSSTWGQRMAAVGARKFLRERGDSCEVLAASAYTVLVLDYCKKGHKLPAAKTLALSDVVTTCNLLGPEKETK